MRNIPLLVTLLGVATLLGGCVSHAPSIPVGYSGPRAIIRDTALVHSSSKVDFFFVNKIADGAIKESRGETLARNYGRGLMMEPVLLDREVPAGSPQVLELFGRTEYAAPILALTNTVYHVKGAVTATLLEGHTYAVKGTLGPDYSAVWIEDTGTQEVVGQKIEIRGSAKLGFWSK